MRCGILFGIYFFATELQQITSAQPLKLRAPTLFHEYKSTHRSTHNQQQHRRTHTSVERELGTEHTHTLQYLKKKKKSQHKEGEGTSKD